MPPAQLNGVMSIQQYPTTYGRCSLNFVCASKLRIKTVIDEDTKLNLSSYLVEVGISPIHSKFGTLRYLIGGTLRWFFLVIEIVSGHRTGTVKGM